MATTSGKLVAVPAAAFDATAPSGPLAAAGLLAASGGSLDSSSGAGAGGGALAGELLVETPCADMVDIAAHPMRPEVYVLGASGDLQRWDVPQRRRAAGRRLPADCRRPRALAVARDASFVAVGFEGGHVALVGAEGLEDIAVMRNSGQPVERWAALACAARHTLSQNLLGCTCTRTAAAALSLSKPFKAGSRARRLLPSAAQHSTPASASAGWWCRPTAAFWPRPTPRATCC